MAAFGVEDFTLRDDDIIEMRVGRPSRRPQSSRDMMDSFIHPVLDYNAPRASRMAPASSTHRPPHRHSRREELRRHQRNVAQRHQRLQNHSPQLHLPVPQASPAVIDLTEEPDSPVETRPPSQAQSQQTGRNPRRTNSQRSTPPRLSRSDSTFMALSAASFIDLTADSPEQERPPEPPRTRSTHAHNTHNAQNAHNATRNQTHFFPGADDLFSVGVVANHHLGLPRGFSGRFLGLLGQMRGVWNQPELDVSRTPFGYHGEPSPKPAMEPVPQTRSGFTRDTCAEPEDGVERVVICPACHEELAYDPAGPAVHNENAASKGRRRRAPGEHHFWALKKCGHVYCADCFENRRPTKATPNNVGFPGLNGVIPAASAGDIRCVVDGCETRVANKSEWVGIFL